MLKMTLIPPDLGGNLGKEGSGGIGEVQTAKEKGVLPEREGEEMEKGKRMGSFLDKLGTN